ncbi:disco-interacting protein 2 [Anthonomus grandis grandis]|uniref:disco-interacting protein 2 n=1 Tax=Anthonomus grandis grandis TaxID=2921223 RepID=UPI002165C503|nr:disco-interacting protein 2 [Anthonomus grandis grandis]
MKPITFENLRRLMGGGRKKKDKDNSSFKRSDSFKRISIRKSYLDRGKKKIPPKLEAATQTVSEEEQSDLKVVRKVDSGVQADLNPPPSYRKSNGSAAGVDESSVLVYSQWLREIKREEPPTAPSKTIKGSERTIIYVPAFEENIIKQPVPVIRQLSSSPVFRKKNTSSTHISHSPTNLQRKESNDSAVEMFPWGDSTEVKKSPLIRRRQGAKTTTLMPVDSEEMCSLSISLGRIWMDAPQAMTPRSLEMPGKSSQGCGNPPAHNSLDSALKDLGPMVSNRLQKRSTPPVARTLSSTSNNTNSTGLFSSKDSGFSFSISAPKLTDFQASFAPNGGGSKGGFFRKKSRPNPKLSVSRDGYFKRTSSAVLAETRRTSLRGSGKKKKKKKKEKDSSTIRSDIYQVICSRPQRANVQSLKLDPMIFVPPEKRKSGSSQKPSFKTRMQEIRHFNPLDSAMYSGSLDSTDEGLYESLPGDYEYLLTDDEDEEEINLESFSMEKKDLKEAKIVSSGYGMVRKFCAREEFVPPPPPSEPRLKQEEGRRYQKRTNLKIIPDLDNFSEEEDSLVSLTDNDEASESESEERSGRRMYVPPGVSPVPRRRPVRRKKSGRAALTHKRSITYLVKPTVIRAPSTLRRTKKSGDITQKGYEKKRSRLLTPYVPKQNSTNSEHVGDVSGSGGGREGGNRPPQQQHTQRRRTQRRVTHNEKRYHSDVAREQRAGPRGGESPSTRAARRGNRRLTRNESRYHSEVRQEAVQQALAQALQNRHKPSMPMPSKRTSVMARSPERERRDSESSSDEDSIANDEAPPTTVESTPEREKATGGGGLMRGGSGGGGHHGGFPPPPPSDTSSAGSPPPLQRRPRVPPPMWGDQRGGSRSQQEITDITEVLQNFRPYSQPPDVTNNTVQGGRRAGADRVNRYNTSVSEDGTMNTGTGRWKVSAKIQQLLNTLKRPKRRPLPEFYEDDDIELELAANPKDPNAPKPEGSCMSPAVGEQLSIPSGLPRNLEAAILRYGNASFKAPVATVLDPNGKLSTTLTYGKLLSRSHKIAYALLTKSFSKNGDTSLKSGDRVALVYPNNDPINFLCAYYGCVQAGIVPVPIEVPITRRDAGSLQIGFLLGSCAVQVALTSELCLKGLPKTTSGEVIQFKGWPRLTWFVTEHLARTPKDWTPQPRLTDETPAYIEYTTDRDGSVMGVTMNRASMVQHCRMLTMACNYTEGENMVCVLDFKREVGLWHSVLTSVLNGMHVIYIPYALMKANPASWMQMITKYRASVAIVKSRDLHWGLLATKDHKDINLASLRMLLVADGANPWSLSSCDQFLSVFSGKGLRADAICPSASSSECLTVSVRRPGRGGVNATGRGVLSMQGLSYGVVRVDQENSLTSLTLQDCGQVMPGCVIVVVKMEGPSYLCKTDEVGEICVNSGATGAQYWGLPGLSNSTFKVVPLGGDGKPISDAEYTRSGLLGFLGPGGLVFVCGSRDGLMTVTGRKHNADDIIATVLAVEPMKFIYRGRIAVFSIRVLRDERICVIAEQRPDCSEEESFQWMSRVLQAVDSIHQVGIYCLALVPPNYLPKTPLGGIHLSETKRRFLEGALHPANVLMCPHTCVTNLPKPREVHSASDSCVSDVGPASVIVGNLVQGNRLASAQGREVGGLLVEEDGESSKKQQMIAEILRWRAQSTSDHVLFTLLNSKGAVAKVLSCSELHKKAERIGNLLVEKGRVNTGDHVALIFPPGLDLICAFYGCLYVGAVPVTIRPPHPQNLQTTLPTVRMIVDVSKSVLVLSTQAVIKLLRSKEASNVVDIKSWPVILDTDDMPKKKLPVVYRAPTAEMLAYLDFSVSTTGMLAGIKMSHAAVTNLCKSMKLACELYPSRHIALCLDPYCGLGFALWCLSSIYSGHHSILIPPSEVEVNPSLWLTAVSQYKVRDTFCSYGVMELCTKGLGSSVSQLKTRGVSLACVRTCVVVGEERPRINLTSSFSKLFSALGLSPRAVSTSFGCRVNVAICLQGASSPEPSTVYVDLRALRNDRVSLVERGSPHSLCLMESGKLLPGVKVIIANPESKGQCGDSHLGEIWVQSGHNASGYFTIYGDESEYGDHFNARLVTGNTGEVYARTGYLGFLRRTEGVENCTDDTTTTVSTQNSSDTESVGSSHHLVPGALDSPAELHDAVFVVGALDETIVLRGMRYHPIDIENSVLRCHKKIAECAVFTWTNLLVVVVELDGNESEALDLVPLVTNTVLEEHHLIVGVVVVVDPGVVPINSRGEKQRMHLRDGFLADQLDPIYVAYNM